MVRVLSCAKINFYLSINGTDGEGYHLIDTVMSSVSLGDIITVRKNGWDNIGISCRGVKKEKNSAYIAAKLFKEKFGVCGFDIDIVKNIPFCAGLGGSSADAAGVLYALSEMFGADKESLREICNRCGSDIFYMLGGGYARASGRGQIITPFNLKNDYDIVIAKPGGGVSTKKAYAVYDTLPPYNNSYSSDDVMRALENRDFNKLNRCCENALFSASKSLLPEIETVYNMLKTQAPAAFMSGSGSACAGVFEDEISAKACAENLVSKGYYARAVKTQNKGVYQI